MRPSKIATSLFLAVILTTSPVFAWGPAGHKMVGAIADRLITGTHAEQEVKKLLGGITLAEASVWADCAKGVEPGKNYAYTSEGRYAECAIYENPQGEAEMSDFVRRNDQNCSPKPGEESCHKQYHYSDVSIQHDHYDSKYLGVRNDDIVHAVEAAIHVLKGDSSPAPFNIKSKREALLLLTHYVGDIHQPLHVGAIYLDPTGKEVNPDAGTFDPRSDTQGGNKILVKGKRMHATWDEVPASLTISRLNDSVINRAKAIPVTSGSVDSWSTAWATGTLGAAKEAFQGVNLGKNENGQWVGTLPANYGTNMSTIKQSQIIQAGARLAQLLQAIWP